MNDRLAPGVRRLPTAADLLGPRIEFGAGGLNSLTTEWLSASLQNPVNTFDVNKNGRVTSLDALRVINELAR